MHRSARKTASLCQNGHLQALELSKKANFDDLGQFSLAIFPKLYKVRLIGAVFQLQ